MLATESLLWSYFVSNIDAGDSLGKINFGTDDRLNVLVTRVNEKIWSLLSPTSYISKISIEH